MRTRRRILICVSLMVLALAVVGYRTWRARLVRSVFGNSQSIGTVKNATSVTAFRLPFPSEFRELLSEYETTAGPVPVSGALARDLRLVLLDASSYGWGYAKGCTPTYGVRIQFQHNTDKVDVLLCFECDILTVYHNGKAVGGEDFDDARSRLLLVVKQLFPDDQAIQSLK